MRHELETLGDTIVACATPPGEGAIAVLRLSGSRARGVLAGLLGRPSPGESHRLRTAALLDADGAVIDRGMFVEMLAPRTYTGEDVVELHVHGSTPVVQALVTRCISLGARQAGPGEFTQRAFLRGRMSLDQAEGVADLIAACNEREARAAVGQLDGGLRAWVGAALEELEDLLATGRAALDFPEYPTGDGLLPADLERASAVLLRIQRLLETGRREVLRRRAIVLCGAPNVGKSTLVNALVGEERVLVDASPGTTRDPVEVEVRTRGGPVRVVDTAGLRDGAAGLEAAGMRLARARASGADLVVWLVDPTGPSWPPADLHVDVWVGAKADLAGPEARRRVEAEAAAAGRRLAGWISGLQVGDVEEAVAVLRGGGTGSGSESMGDGEVRVARQRHLEALEAAAAALERMLGAVGSAWGTADVLVMELEEAARALGRILGRDADTETLARIFAQFCVGK